MKLNPSTILATTLFSLLLSYPALAVEPNPPATNSPAAAADQASPTVKPDKSATDLPAAAADQASPMPATLDQDKPATESPMAVNKATSPLKPKSIDGLEYTGKIIYVESNGGFYGVESETGEKYVPTNLPELLKQNGLWVQVTAKITNDNKEKPNWGTPIQLVKIAADPCLIPEVQVE